MKVSILTPTVRPEGIHIVHNALRNQTFQDFEWLVGTPNVFYVHGHYTDDLSPRDYVASTPKIIVDDFKDGFWTLNRIYNKMFKEAKGEVIVSLQDFIWVPEDALKKLVKHIEETDGVVSGVGDQYARLDASGKPTEKIWSDPRKTDKYGDFYECNHNDAEWNWGGFPKHWIYDVGGMDEELDFWGFGGDQFQVGERLDEMGCKFYLDQTNESFTLRHDRSYFGGQEHWDKNHVLFNGAYQERKKELQKEGKWPVLDYLH